MNYLYYFYWHYALVCAIFLSFVKAFCVQLESGSIFGLHDHYRKESIDYQLSNGVLHFEIALVVSTQLRILGNWPSAILVTSLWRHRKNCSMMPRWHQSDSGSGHPILQESIEKLLNILPNMTYGCKSLYLAELHCYLLYVKTA